MVFEEGEEILQKYIYSLCCISSNVFIGENTKKTTMSPPPPPKLLTFFNSYKPNLRSWRCSEIVFILACGIEQKYELNFRSNIIMF
jgi:hypothetical protein